MKIYFSENLKRLRTQKGLTQEKLANFIGVSYQTISKWENSDTYPDITTLPAIAKFFNVSIDELLGVNQAENEAEIAEQIKAYDNLTDKRPMWDLISTLKEKFPNDFRVLIRYIAYLSRYSDDKSKRLFFSIFAYRKLDLVCSIVATINNRNKSVKLASFNPRNLIIWDPICACRINKKTVCFKIIEKYNVWVLC